MDKSTVYHVASTGISSHSAATNATRHFQKLITHITTPNPKCKIKVEIRKFGADGLHPHLGNCFAPAELLKKLTGDPPKEQEKKFTAQIQVDSAGMCVLVCKACNNCLCCSRSPQTMKNHA